MRGGQFDTPAASSQDVTPGTHWMATGPVSVSVRWRELKTRSPHPVTRQVTDYKKVTGMQRGEEVEARQYTM
jgi:hypothetical protein